MAPRHQCCKNTCCHTVWTQGCWSDQPTGIRLTSRDKLLLRHNLLLLGGSPCQHFCSTSPSSEHSNLPSSSRSQHCSHREGSWCPLAGTPRRFQGSLFHAPCSTTPSCLLTNLPANWHSHLRNCKDRLVAVAQLALVVGQAGGRLAARLARLAAGSQHGALGSTTFSCLPSTHLALQPRN